MLPYMTKLEVNIPAKEIDSLNGGILSVNLFDTKYVELSEDEGEFYFWRDPVEMFEYT